jgi:DNA-binding cell septation regulator SpoVG
MIRCLKFTALEKGCLRGFADLTLANGLIIHDAMLMESSGRRWVNLPGKPQLGKDKNPVLKDGKYTYVQVLSIPDRELRDKFSTAALAAIDTFRRGQPAQPSASKTPTTKPADRPFDGPLPF